VDRPIADLYEHPLVADPGFSRMSAAWQSSLNDRSLVVRLAKQLTGFDPELR